MKGIFQQGDFIINPPAPATYAIGSAIAANSMQLFDIPSGKSQQILAIDENGFVQTTTAGAVVSANTGFETFPSVFGQVYMSLIYNSLVGPASVIVRCNPTADSSIVSLSFALNSLGSAGNVRLGIFDKTRTCLAQTALVALNSLNLGLNTLPLKDSSGNPVAINVSHAEPYYLGILVDSTAAGYQLTCMNLAIVPFTTAQGTTYNAVYSSQGAINSFDFSNAFNGASPNGTYPVPHIQANGGVLQ
jgi:hypothetical protein